MILDNWLHFLHILSAIVWVGGGLILSVIGARVRSSKDPNAIPEFAQTLSLVGIRILMPAVIGTLVFGVWMVLENSQWNFGQLWVRLALGLFVVAFLIGGVYLGRVGTQLARLTADRGAEAQVLMNRWLVGYRVALVVLLVIVWDMVFKPGLGGG